MLHKCTDTECPSFGQRTSSSCGCHQTDEQVLRAENERLRAALTDLTNKVDYFNGVCSGTGDRIADRAKGEMHHALSAAQRALSEGK